MAILDPFCILTLMETSVKIGPDAVSLNSFMAVITTVYCEKIQPC